MAEAHAAVAFSFTVTPEGSVQFNVNNEALWAVWDSCKRSWARSAARFKNRLHNGVYPASFNSLAASLAIVAGFTYAQIDVSFGLIPYLEHSFPAVMEIRPPWDMYTACAIGSTLLWISGVYTIRYSLTYLLSYTGWMYEPRGKMSMKTKLWLGIVKFLGGRKPMLYSWQGSLPKLPVPSLDGTMRRYLQSVRPLMNDEEHERMTKLTKEFQNGIGRRLQRYVKLKYWWSTNYVSDWWEEYVYLRGRAPIMVNSNFYGVDTILIQTTKVQAARAANIIYGMLQFMREVEHEELSPILLNKTVPLCSWQYERQFNTTRIPGIETDTLQHLQDTNHIAVYHKGRYFKIYFRRKERILKPCELEIMLQKILDDTSEPSEGEEHLAALTAGERTPWAEARKEYFSKGVNKTSLDAIEKAAFCLSLDEEEYGWDPETMDIDENKDHTVLDNYGRAMLHGKGYDRWFDKSFTLVVGSNGRIGFNGEHSWADAPIMAHMWEFSLASDLINGYDENGHCTGEVEAQPPNPVRLQWDIPQKCQEVIENSLQAATNLLNDVDLHLVMHNMYGKGFIKKCKVSPDAYIQMALQLAYYRDAGKFCLTYEASMTRLYREGRTETVRSCTVQSSAFVKSMDDPSKTNKERIAALREACEMHQEGYRNAMTGRGIDRHLFCLYVVSKYLGVDSPFLKEVLSEPWRLSTSQTPHQQTTKLDLVKHPEYISAGGGFGPVADDGYGVSYVIAGEDCIFFHISCKNRCPETKSYRFGERIKKALDDMRHLFDD